MSEPGAQDRSAALAEEQAAVDVVHARVDELRDRAVRRSRAAGSDRSGSTFQARYERDVLAHHHASRAARLSFGDAEQVVFGRLDTDVGETVRVGRVSVVDDEGDSLLVDWRAPAAEAFYRATAAHPMAVARRRQLVAQGQRVRDLDDELLDVDAAERLGLDAVTGQGALLAALERTRTGHMRDIVATIQADQDEIIRSEAGGTLVVAGGPGTGKTVVALHRVAYLLYTHRERMAGRGVLVVGPSNAFTRYVERVLPALGEDRAVLRSLAGFAPAGVPVRGWDRPEVAAVSGSAVMAEVCRRLLGAAVPPIPPTTRVVVDDLAVDVPARDVARSRERLLRRVEPGVEGRRYHDRAHAAEQAMREVLWSAWARRARSTGMRVPDSREGTGFDQRASEAPGIELLRRCHWPDMHPVSVLGALIDGRIDLDDVAGDLLDDEQRAVLRAAWDGRTAPTIDDVALLDELDALLGPPPKERAARAEVAVGDGGLRVGLDDGPAPEGPDLRSRRYDEFAHVVVDEAQDLSPMQWRMVARRGAYASWTVVGDLAQRSRTAEPSTWEEVAALIGRRQVAIRTLRVNYRTPAEVVDVARDVLRAAGLDPALAPEAVRSIGERPLLRRTGDLTAACIAAVATALERQEGTVAVIAEDDRIEELRAVLPDDERLVVHDPRTVKGLEFDEVVVVAPDELVAASSIGAHTLYVAVTRTTTRLTLLASPGVDVPGAAACDEVLDPT